MAARLCQSEECYAPAEHGLKVCRAHTGPAADGRCVVLGCSNEPEGRGGMCSTHKSRQQRGSDIARPVATRRVAAFTSSLDRLARAAVEYAFCDSEDDSAYKRAERELCSAASAYSVLRAVAQHRRSTARERHRAIVGTQRGFAFVDTAH